jgi:hypothetical protein
MKTSTADALSAVEATDSNLHSRRRIAPFMGWASPLLHELEEEREFLSEYLQREPTSPARR